MSLTCGVLINDTTSSLFQRVGVNLFLMELLKIAHTGPDIILKRSCKTQLGNAYFHIPVHPQCWKYMRFAIGDQVYQFKAMCFGLAPAPFIFTKVLCLLAEFLRKEGIFYSSLFGQLDHTSKIQRTSSLSSTNSNEVSSQSRHHYQYSNVKFDTEKSFCPSRNRFRSCSRPSFPNST